MKHNGRRKELQFLVMSRENYSFGIFNELT